MRKSVLALSLVSIVAAGAAFAAPVSSGAAQLAAQVGVNAEDYTAGQLAALWSAKHDADAAAPFEAVKAATNAVSVSSQGAASISPARAQLAAQLGVNPADYSTAELVALVAQLDTN